MAGACALPHLDKDHRAIGFTHDQVDFSTASPRGPIIALKQFQSCLLKMA
jgi:hypothetical protein